MLIFTGVFISFFRVSVRWVCITDDHDFVLKGRIKSNHKKGDSLFEGQ